MKLRPRFALLALVLTMIPSWVFTQESTSTKATESAAPEQTAVEHAKLSKTHCEIPACVYKVLYFSSVSQPFEFQDVTNAMRTIAEISRIQQVPGSRIIIVEGTPEQIAMAEKLAAEIDRDKRRFGGLGCRIDLKVQESGSDTKAQTRAYSFVTEAREVVRVTAERQTPAHAQSEPTPEKSNRPMPGANGTSNA
jgi:hypothetical protein